MELLLAISDKCHSMTGHFSFRHLSTLHQYNILNTSIGSKYIAEVKLQKTYMAYFTLVNFGHCKGYAEFEEC